MDCMERADIYSVDTLVAGQRGYSALQRLEDGDCFSGIRPD